MLNNIHFTSGIIDLDIQLKKNLSFNLLKNSQIKNNYKKEEFQQTIEQTKDLFFRLN